MKSLVKSLAITLFLLSPSISAGPQVVHPDVHRLLEELDAPVKVWVFLEDKGFADAESERAALAQLEASFPERALARRALRRRVPGAPGLVDARDLPLAEAALAAVRAIAPRVHVESRWLNAVSVTVDADQLERLQALPFVRGIRPVNRSVLASASVGGCFGSGGGFYGEARSQIELNNIDGLHALGYTGAGVVIGVLDTGFVTTHDAFHEPGHEIDVLASWDFVNDDANVGIDPGDDPFQHDHGTVILGTMAAYDPNTLVGAAYDASYILCKTEDVTSETQVEEDFYVAGLEFAELNGADVVTSSLGYIEWYTQQDLDGRSAVTTVAVNIATANGVHCLTPPGNAGHDEDPQTSTLIAPSDAFDAITVGAMEITGEVAFFSSDGPTADGRVKPEIVTMGDNTASVSSGDDTSIVCASGTSLSTPMAAGLVACLTQAHPEWGVTTMRNQLIASSDYFGEPAPDPLFIFGYGAPDAALAATAPVTFQLDALQPGAAGAVNTTEVTGATPGNFVFFAWGVVPANLPLGCGVSLGTFPILLLQADVADAGGEAAVSVGIPGTATGITLLLHAIELDTCQASAVVSTSF